MENTLRKIIKKNFYQFAKKIISKFNLFSKNFDNLLNKSSLLITNSGLTKYEVYCIIFQ